MTTCRRRLLARALSFGVAVVAGASCVETREVLDIVLEPVLAQAVADELHGRPPGPHGGRLGFSWIDDDGGGDGLGAAAGSGFTLSPRADRLSFSVRLDDDGYTSLLGLGRTGFVAVRDDDGVAVSTLQRRVLVAPVDRVGLLTGEPPAPGGDGCVVGDEAGRLFVVGGSAGDERGGFVVDDFGVVALDGAGRFAGAPISGCGASGGAVAAVADCGRAGAVVVVVVAAGVDGVVARTVSLAALASAGAPVSCGARVAPVDGGVWVADGAALSFVADDGVVVSTTSSQPGPLATAGFAALSTTPAGDAVVVDGPGVDGVWRVVTRAGGVRVVRAGLGPGARLVRRAADVVLLDGAQLVGPDGDVVRGDVADDVSGGDVVGVVALSDDTVVALAERELRVSRSGVAVVRLSLAAARAGLAALPGDTVVLAGGDAAGVDVVALSEQRVMPR
jgi:hypothetical protein